ncbi:MAG: TRAP transporter large permease [Alphaproteobacteria bacterium]
MDLAWLGLAFLGGMLVLIALGVPIAFSMLITGILGMLTVGTINQAQGQLILNVWDRGTSFVLTTIPLYILMGQLVYRTRIASDLYDAVYRWLGWLPGGLAITSVVACAGFGAVSGGSATAVATLGPMCMPEMRKYNYSNKLAAGSISSAGTLGILIPPSIILVVYGVWTETSIGHLFIAGIVPGILMTIAFSVIILALCIARPELGPPGVTFPWGERIRSLSKVLPTFLVFFIVIGGIYGGVFDPSEGAAIGVSSIVVIALAMGRLDWAAIRISLISTMHTTGMLFLIITGGHVLGHFIVLTKLTEGIVIWLTGLGLDWIAMIIVISLIYILLGMILDVWAMLILTIPFLFPVILAFGIDPVWFGIYATVMTELALITPPVGVNVYVMAKVAPDVPLNDIFVGVAPFFLAVLGIVVLITIWPELVLWLPQLAFG